MFSIRRKWRGASAPSHTDAAAAASSGHRPIDWGFWLICASLIAIVICQSGYMIWKERQTALELQRRNVANVSLVLAAQTSRYIGVFDIALQNVQRMLHDARTGSAAAFRTELSRASVRDDMVAMIRNVPGDPALLAFDAEGVLVNTTRSIPSIGLSFADRDYFMHFRDRDDRGIYVSVPTKSRVSGKWTIYLSRRLGGSDGQFRGVVAAAVVIDDLQGFYHSVFPGSGEAITLLRNDGVVLARFPDPGNAIGTSMPKKSPWYRVVANKGGTYRSPGFFGARPSIVYARLLDGYPMVIDVVVSEYEAFALWHVNTLLSVSGAAIVSLSLLWLFWMIDRQVRHQNELLEFTRGLIDVLPGFFALVDGSGRIARWNDNLETLTGLDKEEMQGFDASMIAIEDMREAVRTKMHEAFAQGSATMEFDVLNKKTGDVRPVLWTGRTITSGGHQNLLAVGLDMTDTNAAQAMVRQGEERLRVIFDSVNDGIVVHDAETGVFLDVNPRMCQMFGYSREEFLKLNLEDLSAGVSPYTLKETESLLRRPAPNEALVFDWRGKAKDGHEFWVEIAVRRAALGGRPVLLSTTRDVNDRHRAQAALEASEAKYRDLFENTPDAIMTLDPFTGNFRSANAGAMKLFGIGDEREFLRGKPWDYSPERQPDGQASIEKGHELIETTLRLGSHRFEWTHKRVDGSEFPADVLLTRVVREGETLLYATVRDLSERKRLDEALRRSQERLALATESARIGIWDWDIAANKLVWDDRMYSLYGIRAQDFSGAYDAWQAGLHPEDRARGDAAINAAIDRVRDFNIEFRVLWPNGETHVIEAHAMVQGPANGRATRMVGVNWDITERKKAEARITQMARQDLLTGLANRGVFVEALQQAIARARRGSGSFAVLYLDLDHFKDVNDTLGHPIGDLLLCAVSERLRQNVRETDLVSRFGGDEFAVLQTDIRDPAEAGIFAEKLLRAIAEPYVLGDTELRSGGSAGIAVFGADSPDAEALLSNADVALYRAKSEGRGTFRFFTDAMNLEVHTRVSLASELREAIAAGQLFLEYQPQVDVDTHRIVGVEALARWRHPTRGLVLPGEFIPAAEKSGLIVALGHSVMREACRQMKEWLDADIAPPLVGVNLSALQFKTPLVLENDIAAILAEMAVPRSRLELELTESVLMETSREHNDVLLRLRQSGIQIAIDDFGNGYSSLAYLSRFPVDRIKIAQNFLLDLPTMPRNRAIVRAAIRLAHELDLLIVVEGVETAAQLDLIRSWSAHQVQGFYFSRPLPASEVTTLLRAGMIGPAVAGVPALV